MAMLIMHLDNAEGDVRVYLEARTDGKFTVQIGNLTDLHLRLPSMAIFQDQADAYAYARRCAACGGHGTIVEIAA